MACCHLITNIDQKGFDRLAFDQGGDAHIFDRANQTRSNNDIAQHPRFNRRHGDVRGRNCLRRISGGFGPKRLGGEEEQWDERQTHYLDFLQSGELGRKDFGHGDVY